MLRSSSLSSARIRFPVCGVRALTLALLGTLCSVCVRTMDAEWSEEGAQFIRDRRRLDGQAIEHSAHVAQRLDRYMAEGMPEVIGWFDYQALLVLRVLAAHQVASGVAGGVAEIGVHHGKSFAALSLLNLDVKEDGTGSTNGSAHTALAGDVFDDQLLNPDGSGEGDLETFRSTVRAWCGEECMTPQRLKVVQLDSRMLTAAQVVAESGGKRPRIFSIDGSHTAEHTEADMKTAAASICTGGIVMVDDYFAEGWPGVSEGVHAFMQQQGRTALDDKTREAPHAEPSPGVAPKIIPFFVGFNKVLFASEESSASYQDSIMSGLHHIGLFWV